MMSSFGRNFSGAIFNCNNWRSKVGSSLAKDSSTVPDEKRGRVSEKVLD